MIREIMADPDAGLELTPHAVRRLEKTLEEKKQGKTRSLYSVLRKGVQTGEKFLITQ